MKFKQKSKSSELMKFIVFYNTFRNFQGGDKECTDFEQFKHLTLKYFDIIEESQQLKSNNNPLNICGIEHR